MVKLDYKLLLILIIFFSQGLLVGQNITIDFVNQEKQNYQYRLGEIPINVINKSEISQNNLELEIARIISLVKVDNFNNIEKINIKLDNRISMVLFYNRLIVNNINIANKINQGIMFYINENGDLIYDFSIFEKNYNIRINGIYDGFEKIENKIISSLENPALFIQQNTPGYFLREIVKNRKSIEELTLDYAKLIESWLAYQNASLFGKPKPISQELQEKIINLKKNNTALTVTEIEKILKEEQSEKVNKKTIELVIALNFSEFKK